MDNTEYLTQITNLQKEQEKAALEAAKTKALTSLEQEQAKQAPIYQGQREQVNVASQIGAKNFAEYMAQRGQTNAGLSAQAEMSRQNVLGRTIGDINKQETQGIQDYQNQRANVETDFNTNLAGAMSKADIGLRENLYNERIRQEQFDAQERARKQSLGLQWAQFNYQKEQDALKNQEQQFVNGSVRTNNGKVQQYLDGKWSDVKYNTTKKGEITNKKTYEWNQKGYGLTGAKSGISYMKDGKALEYNIWVKDNIPHIIANGIAIPLAIPSGTEQAMNTLLDIAVTRKEITPEQREELLNKIETY